MKTIMLRLDPRLSSAIDRLAAARGISRSHWLRNALYTAVVRAVRVGIDPEESPTLPYAIAHMEESAHYRVYRGRLARVDDDGLVTDVTE